MIEPSLLSLLVQGGGIGIALALIWVNWKERTSVMSEWREERAKWYETVNNHMNHDMELHQKQMVILQKQTDAINALIKKLNGRAK